MKVILTVSNMIPEGPQEGRSKRTSNNKCIFDQRIRALVLHYCLKLG